MSSKKTKYKKIAEIWCPEHSEWHDLYDVGYDEKHSTEMVACGNTFYDLTDFISATAKTFT